jgi:glycosyltransferase involved in cell wall biosynthesis
MDAAVAFPKVSVVVPCYRQAGFVTRCLDGVAGQTYRGPIEVIVVDDGCPEGSGDVAQAHGLAPKVLRLTNGGVANARNRGAAEASAQLIAFLDADDVWYPEKLERQVERMLALDSPSLCFTRYRRLAIESGKSTTTPPTDLKPTFALLTRLNFIGCSTVLVHKDCLSFAGGFPDSRELRRGGQDYALWLRIATRFPLLYVPEILVDYMIHEGSRVGMDALKNFEGAVNALRSFRGWSDAATERRSALSRRRLVLKHFSHAWDALGRSPADYPGRLRALRALFRALRE